MASTGVLDREMGAEGWMISPTRLRYFADSTPALPRVDSDTSPSRLGGVAESTPIPSTSRLGDAFDSTRRSVRLDSKLQGLRAVENKKGADSSESTPKATMIKILEEKIFNPLNLHQNCCHPHH